MRLEAYKESIGIFDNGGNGAFKFKVKDKKKNQAKWMDLDSGDEAPDDLALWWSGKAEVPAFPVPPDKDHSQDVVATVALDGNLDVAENQESPAALVGSLEGAENQESPAALVGSLEGAEESALAGTVGVVDAEAVPKQQSSMPVVGEPDRHGYEAANLQINRVKALLAEVKALLGAGLVHEADWFQAEVLSLMKSMGA